MALNRVLEAQARFQAMLLSKPNVVGVAVGYKDGTGESDELAVVTLVQQKKPLAALSADELVPQEVGGVRTDVIEIGYVRAYGTDNPRSRFRPTIPSGVSLGHYKITAGTLGAIVTDQTTGEKLILSNNHVIANSNDALVGDNILQPGPADGGQNPGDLVARLERFIRIRYVDEPDTPTPTPPPGGGCDVVSVIVALANILAALTGSSQRVAPTTAPQVTSAATGTAPIVEAQVPVNEVDAAVAKPLDPNMFTGEILGIGPVSGTKPPVLGMRVRKSGRTTGYTEGTITLLNATVNVAYGNRTARFGGQFITGAMSQGGDSGSLLVDGTENKAVGLLFAGSNVATIFNPISAVLDTLKINI